jgi:hypothetical protein
MGFEKWKFMVKQCGMLYAKQKAFQITDCILCVLRSEIIQLVIWKWPETNIRPHYFRLFHNNQSINSAIPQTILTNSQIIIAHPLKCSTADI